MNSESIATAIAEAERFIKKAKEAQAALDAGGYGSSPKQTGACRRASMDLTRALAELRSAG